MDIITYGLLNQKADLKSPHLKGSPTATNPKKENNSKRIATTHFVHEVVKNNSMGLRTYGYNIEPGGSLTLETSQVYLLIGRGEVSDIGIACLIDQWGGIIYFSKNNSIATIQSQNGQVIITNLCDKTITAVCTPYSIYINK